MATAISALELRLHHCLIVIGSVVAFLTPPVPGMPLLNLPVGSGSRRGIGTLLTGSQGKIAIPCLA